MKQERMTDRARRLECTPSGFMYAVRRLKADRAGAVALFIGLALPMLVGFAGLAVDTAGWILAKTWTQGVADAAALSVLSAAAAGETASQAITQAAAVAASHGLKNGQNGVSVTVNNPPLSGAYAGNSNAFEVIISAQQESSFSKIFGYRPVVRGRAVTVNNSSSQPVPCILALDPTSRAAFTMSGGAVVTAVNCGAAANSSDSSGVVVSGNGTAMTVDDFAVLGGYSVGNGAKLTSKTIRTGVTTPDPYESLATPGYSMSCIGGDIAVTGTYTINPGVYCGNISAGNGSFLTMRPGTYILQGGSFKLTNASINAQGVSIILTPDYGGRYGSVQITGGASVTMTPPTSGAMQGVLIYMDRRAPNATNTIAGNANSVIKGALYFPSQTIQFTGGTSTGGGCIQLIGSDVKFAGGSSFGTDCGSLVVPGFNSGNTKVRRGIPAE